MPKLPNRSPRLCHEKRSGQAVVRIDGQKLYLGAWGKAKTKQNYDRIVAEWLANNRQLPHAGGAAVDLTINELLLAYWEFANEYYRKGDQVTQAHHIKTAFSPLKRLYGHILANEFGPLALKSVRQAMIEDGQCRNYVNGNVGWIKGAFKWGVENELVQPTVYHGLQAVAGLKRGRCEARESEPVKPVPEAFVEAVLPHLSRQVAAMIRVQSLTGMRPGEVCILRTCDLDMSGRLWIYVPASHKTEHHGHKKIIHLGPRAQKILRPWLRTELHAFLFSPLEAEEERNSRRRQVRRSPMTPSQARRNPKKNPKRPKRDHYEVAAYRRAIERGIEQANKQIEDPEKRIPHWHPHQLRHNAGTKIRKEYGLEAARVVLGHRSAAVTEVYAEIDHAKAAEIMAKVG